MAVRRPHDHRDIDLPALHMAAASANLFIVREETIAAQPYGRLVADDDAVTAVHPKSNLRQA
jgi:hypothetical protein